FALAWVGTFENAVSHRCDMDCGALIRRLPIMGFDGSNDGSMPLDGGTPTFLCLQRARAAWFDEVVDRVDESPKHRILSALGYSPMENAVDLRKLGRPQVGGHVIKQRVQLSDVPLGCACCR